MLNADSIGNEKYLNLVTERLVKETKGFFNQFRIALGIKSKKNTPKAISIIKEDRQTFGVILGDKIDLSEALKYTITSISLSIGNPDGTLRQRSKNSFRIFLIGQSSAIQTQPPFKAVWIIDIMAIIRSAKSKKTYKEWLTALIKIVTPKKYWNS